MEAPFIAPLAAVLLADLATSSLLRSFMSASRPHRQPAMMNPSPHTKNAIARIMLHRLTPEFGSMLAMNENATLVILEISWNLQDVEDPSTDCSLQESPVFHDEVEVEERHHNQERKQALTVSAGFTYS
jgi:hypothetical protein